MSAGSASLSAAGQTASAPFQHLPEPKDSHRDRHITAEMNNDIEHFKCINIHNVLIKGHVFLFS